jgi:hypothetical protein
MKIIEGWNGARWLWVVREYWSAQRQKETAFTSAADAKAYRDLVRAQRRTSDPVQQGKLAETIKRMREQAFMTIG